MSDHFQIPRTTDQDAQDRHARDQHAQDRPGTRAAAARAARRPPRTGRAWRAGTMAVTATVLAVATAACGAGGTSGGGAAAGSDSPATASAESPTTGASDAPDSSGTSAQSAASPGTEPGAGTASGGAKATTASRCTADQLGISLGPPDVGAGNIRYDLRLVNKASSACTLQGFPGVSLLAGDGAPIGKPATREGGQLGAVRLAPGGAAQTTLHTLNKGIKGSSCWAAPSLIKIYPPGSKDAMTLSTSKPVVCGDTFTVTAMRAG
ncbi:DUF4232 domain-containing protein [Streptomyces sp. NBC_01429]|uniref:DUF4232 domain-containing protein n=1 Tax=Streptomyces sp. NBC_01429 TaxID=2903862 RepID=UPI002E2E2AAB|nr:DUF4232 domain-containing protein [Streptomyces sp. NBC_01429]